MLKIFIYIFMAGIPLPYDVRKIDVSRTMRKEMTPPEKILWYSFLSKRKPAWRRQKIIGPFIADFYCPSIRMVIEVDGNVHSEQGEYDQERDKYMEYYGITIVRIPARNIFQNIFGVCEYLETIILQ